MNLEDARREYRFGRLLRESLEPTPIAQFRAWMEQAMDAGIGDPTAMTVTSVNKMNEPWSRVVLLKSFDEAGLCFYTNLKSRKALDIQNNSRVSLHFPWMALDRQVIVGGNAEVLEAAQAKAYFKTRPRESQIATWVAVQSEEIENRQVLDDEFQRLSSEFEGKEVPMPSHWGGYIVQPKVWEFWQGGENRLHDRFQYEKTSSSDWAVKQLAP